MPIIISTVNCTIVLAGLTNITISNYITNNNTWYYYGYDDSDRNWRKGFEMYFLKQGKRLSNLKDFTHKTFCWRTSYVMYWTIITNSYPSQMTVDSVKKKIVHDVTMKNSQFVLLYTELYHYYGTHSVSFTYNEDYLIIQIPMEWRL